MSKPTKVEKFHIFNTLTCLVKALEGKYTVIDLRNESCVTGLIKEVDGYMNVQMEDVILYDPRGNEFAFQLFFISARNIRYVHIPENTSSEDLIKEQLASLRYKVPKKKVHTYKTSRAQKYQQEIVQSIQKEISTKKN